MMSESVGNTSSGMVSLWSLAVIAFERWLVICKPLGNFIFKPDHAVACCVLTWIFALIASVPPLVGWSRLVLSVTSATAQVILAYHAM